jgi:hypothetical protein
MELQDPVVVYTAASNLEAYDVAEWLGEAQIPSHVVEDLEVIAAWAGGLNTAIHRPQVWVSQVNQDEALAEIQKYEDRRKSRRAADLAKIAQNQTVLFATCEKCGVESEFPVVQSGSVQQCSNCSAYMDVDVDPDFIEWDVGQPEPLPPESRFYE